MRTVQYVKVNMNWPHMFSHLIYYIDSMITLITIHSNNVIMGAMTSQITSLTTVYSTACSGADQRKHQSSASLAFVDGIHQWPVNSPHKGPVKRKILPFDDIIIIILCINDGGQDEAEDDRDHRLTDWDDDG